MTSIGIIGGGFSGAIAAYHLLASLPTGSEIMVYEPNKDLGRGVAYADLPDHFLLNVPALLQSPCSDDPESFLRWVLKRSDEALQYQQWDGAYYVPRAWFGTYMGELVADRVAQRSDISFQHVRAPIIGLRDDGGRPLGVTRDGARIFDAIVLALGNAPPRPLPVCTSNDRTPRVIQSAWELGQLPPPPPDAHIVIVGTGLTMVDAVADLAAKGHKGLITCVSRHGLFHNRSGGHNPEFSPPAEPLERTTRALTRQIRRWCELSERIHGDWRPAIDYVRINAPTFWRGLSPTEQARFARHVRPHWNIHRYQAPSRGYDLIQELSAMKRLIRVKGDAAEICDDGLVISRNGARETISCDLVINAIGPDLSHRTAKFAMSTRRLGAVSGPLGAWHDDDSANSATSER
jgi:uncharacterized NAD(P)/FAD-binding protein YdhS